MSTTTGPVMRVREHEGFGHGLRPGTDRDINCASCIREDAARTACPPGFARRSGQGATGGHTPAPGLGNQAVARVLADVLRQLEACWPLAEGDVGRSGLDYLVIDVEDVATRCFGGLVTS